MPHHLPCTIIPKRKSKASQLPKRSLFHLYTKYTPKLKTVMKSITFKAASTAHYFLIRVCFF
ncbi:Uncharacterised protein [Segatella copri]|nr:Uncharacterised protein [Segatella copri]